MIEKFSFNNSFGKKINIKNCLIINFFFSILIQQHEKEIKEYFENIQNYSKLKNIFVVQIVQLFKFSNI